MNKIVLITGGSSGYGLATAKKFVEAGDTVIISARNEEKLKKAFKESGCAEYIVFDVTDYTAWEKVKAYIMEKYGRLDILVNNAGGGVAIRPVDELTATEIDKTVKLNLNGAIYGCNLFVPVMKTQKSGAIVNVSSVCATHAWGAWSVYAAAKAGLRAFSKGLHVEVQPYGVRVTCLIPAAADTDFSAACGRENGGNSLLAEDIADAIFFACYMPERAVVEEVTVWGMSQTVEPM